jgi:cytidine deaminase
VNLTVIWRFLLGACELRHIFVCKENTAIVTVKISGATAQNLVFRVTRDQGYVQPCSSE